MGEATPSPSVPANSSRHTMSMSSRSLEKVAWPKRSGSEKLSPSGPIPLPEKLKETAVRPACAKRSASFGKKPQSLKPLNP